MLPSLRLFNLRRLFCCGLAPEPHAYEPGPARHCYKDPQNPHIRPANRIAAGVFIVRKMAYRDGALLIDVGEERPLVVQTEVEDAVLVWELECRCEDCRVLRIRLPR